MNNDNKWFKLLIIFKWSMETCSYDDVLIWRGPTWVERTVKGKYKDILKNLLSMEFLFFVEKLYDNKAKHGNRYVDLKCQSMSSRPQKSKCYQDMNTQFPKLRNKMPLKRSKRS